jgi:DNA-binding winged helix-turn-helix (wHTH) protein
MTMNTYAKPALDREYRPPHAATSADAALGFGRFRVLLRQRQLVADGVTIELGTRAFDVLLVLLEADGSLVTKDELVSRVWPGIVVAEENLKVQISALRKALGEDRDLIRTEFGRGYRFTATVRSTVTRSDCQRTRGRGFGSSQRLVPQWISGRPPHDWCVRSGAGGRFDPAHTERAASCRYWISSAVRKREET